jgi:hypothetical protein
MAFCGLLLFGGIGDTAANAARCARRFGVVCGGVVV